MNAHTPRRSVAAGSTEVIACPAEALAREIAHLQRRIFENDMRPAPEAFAGLPAIVERQLMDRIDALQHQLEWIRPSSLAGVYAQLLQLQSLAHDAGLADESPMIRETLLRRFDRLNALALEGLERLAGIEGDLLGKLDQQVRTDQLTRALGDIG